MGTLDQYTQTGAPLVVITDYDDRLRMLKEMREANMVRPIRFMTEKDLFDKVFFAYNDHALHEASKTLNTTPEVAESFLDFLFYVDETASYGSKRLKTLQSLKRRLREKGALEIEDNLDSWFKGSEILLMKPVHDPFTIDALERLETRYPVTRAYGDTKQRTFKHTVLKTLEDEVTDIAIRMASYHEKGVPYERMALLNAHSAYEPHIRSVFPMLGIPFNLDRAAPLYTFSLAQDFLARLDGYAEASPYDAFKEILGALRKGVRTDEEATLLSEITRTLNPMVRLEGTVGSLRPLISHALRQGTHRATRYQNGVTIGTLGEGGHQAFDHVFVVGMHEGHAPAYEESDDYLSEAEKTDLGYPDVRTINQSRKAAFLDHLARYGDVHIFESNESMLETYHPATILETISKAHKLEKTDPEPLKDQPYSEALDLIRSKMAYDDYVLNDTVSETLKTLYPLFKDTFTPHDPSWTGLEEDTLGTLLGETFSVSTTQIDRYAECAFRFLLEDLLDVDPVDDPFNTDLGTFFHDVLEHALHLDTIDDTLLEDTLKRTLSRSDKDYSGREVSFFRKAYPFIRRAHRVIRSQHLKSAYEHSESEAKVEMHFDLGRHVTFKGKIDKVMRRDNKFFLVDYKTGDKTLDLTLAPHGMKAQLVFYVLLYLANVEDSQPTGFFEQTVYPRMPKRVLGKTKENQYEEALRLKGYVVDDMEALEAIDPDYESDPMIHGLSITKKGDFQKKVKRFDEDGIEKLLDTLRTRLRTMLEGIAEGHFPINPKQNQKRKAISCAYCPFADICYKRPEDFETLDVEKDFQALFETLREED